MATGSLSSKPVQNYHADVAFNGVNNMMDSNSYVSVLSINNRFDKYYGKVIKDFYRGSLDNTTVEYYNIYDWGLVTGQTGLPCEQILATFQITS